MNKFNKCILKEEYIKPKKISDLVLMANKGESINEEEKTKIFSYLRHIPNYNKSEEEWNLYCKMSKEKGLPTPDKNSKIRPLHEK